MCIRDRPWTENGGGARGFKPMCEGWYRKSFPTRRSSDLYWGSVEYWGESNKWPKKWWNYSFFEHTMRPYPQAYLIKTA